MMKAGRHIISLSLGSPAEPSAVVVIDPRTEFETQDKDNYFDVTRLRRFPAKHPITAIVSTVEELMSDKRLAKNCHLILDITSTGEAPLRVFESRGLYPERCVDLTNTGSEEHTGVMRCVPLRDVIGVAQVVVQTNRLRVAEDLKLAPTLSSDLLGFDHKKVARSLDLRGGRNADLVLALSVALWWADDLTWGEEPREHVEHAIHRGPGAWMG